MPVVWDTADTKDAVRRYLAGESSETLAAEYGVTRPTVRAAVRRAGHEPRTRREAAVARMLRDLGRHAAMQTKAHDAIRGRAMHESALESRSLSRQRSRSQVGRGEDELARWLMDRGLRTEPQRAVGRYNLDLAVRSTALEVHSFKRSPLTRPHLERIKYLTDRGWHVVYVWVTEAHPLQEAVADEVVAFLEGPGFDPATPGQYRVVRGCGELVASGCGDVDHWAGVRTPYSTHRRFRTNY